MIQNGWKKLLALLQRPTTWHDHVWLQENHCLNVTRVQFIIALTLSWQIHCNNSVIAKKDEFANYWGCEESVFTVK